MLNRNSFFGFIVAFASSNIRSCPGVVYEIFLMPKIIQCVLDYWTQGIFTGLKHDLAAHWFCRREGFRVGGARGSDEEAEHRRIQAEER